MKKISSAILIIIILFLIACQSKNEVKKNNSMNERLTKQDTVVKMGNINAELYINLRGGSYFDFHLKNYSVNPISWRGMLPEEKMFMGHFICFDRWGPPSTAEKANGFKLHGEASTQLWELLAPPVSSDEMSACSMRCVLPMAGLRLTRKIEFSVAEPVFFVTEEIKNLNKNGRMFNIVQHVTLGPPFLDKTTLFDNNTLQGFEDREDGSLNQDNIVLKWPVAEHNGEKVSLRQFDNEWPDLTSFVYDKNDEYGWVTACNPSKKLMVGYLWRTKEYPWVNFWKSMEGGIPMAYAMEFGTTGLHEPFYIVAEKGKIFGRNIYAFIDADEVISKSFTAFLAVIPEDYNGVEKIEVSDFQFVIKEKSKTSRDIIYHLK
jgi:hypothetical protein